MNIGNNSGINKVDKCVIYKSMVNRTWVEEGEVSVFDTRRMKVEVGVGMSIQGHAIDRVAFLATPLNSHTISD
jgi:hypothetical protein